MKVHLLCKSCERPITKVLTPFSDAGSDVEYYYLKNRWRARKKTVDPRDVLLTFEDGLPLVPEGTAYDASDNLAIFNPLPGLFDVSQSWFNPTDILPHIGRNEMWDQGVGCCGTTIVDATPNRVCDCGMAVGFEISECYVWNVFIGDNRTTQWARVNPDFVTPAR